MNIERSDLKPARTSSEKKLRLLPGRKVPAFLNLVVMDEFGIRPPSLLIDKQFEIF